MTEYDVIIIGASASGLMCAIEAGRRQRRVLVLDHANKAGKKILMSGGGRCNFTNRDVSADNFISHNPHFCKSALSRFSQWDVIALVEAHGIAYHEREHGQLFCNDSAKQIRDLLLAECRRVNVTIHLETHIQQVTRDTAAGFRVASSRGEYVGASLVIASGGLSIPKMGATPFGYKVAEQFGIKVWPPVAGLVPFTLHEQDKARFAPLAGIAVACVVRAGGMSFRENLLFTHRGLSGPAMLQVSSYWQPGETLHINLLPDVDLESALTRQQQQSPRQQVKTVLSHYLPKRLLAALLDSAILESTLASLSARQRQALAQQLQDWCIQPNGTEGYRTAEVTVGGVDTDALSSRTLECKDIAGLYFIGEVVDVTGWLGGYNFQWAWSSGWCAGQYV
ncbi:MAG: NAD(P)/FAD-dependent oxidoreductase [Gammaproteobacteria bacterium]